MKEQIREISKLLFEDSPPHLLTYSWSEDLNHRTLMVTITACIECVKLVLLGGWPPNESKSRKER